MALPSQQSVLEKEKLIRFIDSLISTCNPAILSDGSNAHDVPLPRLIPHACSARYTDIVDHPQDLADLIATCQHHTHCSPNYCLHIREGQQACRFGYPQTIQPITVISTEDCQIEVKTA